MLQAGPAAGFPRADLEGAWAEAVCAAPADLLERLDGSPLA
ncbi:hypothetical protein ABT187_48425 [Streptomyces sp. NPDC001817]